MMGIQQVGMRLHAWSAQDERVFEQFSFHGCHGERTLSHTLCGVRSSPSTRSHALARSRTASATW